MKDGTGNECEKTLGMLAGSLPYTRFDGGTLTIGLAELASHSPSFSLYWWGDLDDSEYQREARRWTENGFDHESGRSYSHTRSEDWVLGLLNGGEEQPLTDDRELNLLLRMAEYCGIHVTWAGGL